MARKWGFGEDGKRTPKNFIKLWVAGILALVYLPCAGKYVPMIDNRISISNGTAHTVLAFVAIGLGFGLLMWWLHEFTTD